ncbi:hypothetical protein CEP54_009659 [Fusarium duplospermum]|uniref:J domain-containing protein n=1 Tax=Fusarium duplospermum TaxID=1325734 RepID=A0A428PPF5_9HYPO|nr:hypothetical protein CEP54_009659 [Fusarium duplospermum]
MDEDTDYYRILEIDDSADKATIKQAVKANYRRLAREHHPDKNPGDENATARFQKIQHAFDILSNDEKCKEYNKGRAGRRREAAARQAREAEQQRNRQEQHDRQRRQQEYQRRQEEERQRQQQKRREEEARRSAAPTPISRLFVSIQSNWTRTHWWLLLGFLIAWIAWSLRTPTVSPPSAPLHKMVEELRIGQSLGELQISFTDKYNLPYELQLMEPLVGALINPLEDRFPVERYQDYSADAVDGAVEACLVISRLVGEVYKTIEAAERHLTEILFYEPPFYYRLIVAYTTKSSQTMDKEARQVLVQMTDSIYESLNRALTTLRTTEHSLGMLLKVLKDIAFTIYGKMIRDKFPGEELGAGVIWEAIFDNSSPLLFENSATGSTSFYDDARQVREVISSAVVTMAALQDRLLVFRRALPDAPLTTGESRLGLCAGVLYMDWDQLGSIQAHASHMQKRIRRHRRLVLSLMHV